MKIARPKLMFVVTEDWYFRSHRLALAARLVEQGFEVAIATRLNSPCADFEAAGLTVFDVPFERSLLSARADWRAVRHIRACVSTWRPDVVCLVALKPILLGGLALGAAQAVGRINAFTGLGYLFTSRQLRARILRRVVIRLLRHVSNSPRCWSLTQNATDSAELAKLKIGTPERLALIAGAGVDMQVFSAASPPPGPCRVLLPARVLVEKGAREFAAAARQIRARRSDVEFVIAGSEDRDNPGAIQASEIQAWVDEGILQWPGHCRDMPDVYAQAHIVCLPSWREGLPKALIEAAACARPLIATDVPGCREICRPEISGILVRPRDPDSLANAIETLLDDSELRNRYGAGARRLAEEEFSTDVVAKELARLVEVCGRESAGQRSRPVAGEPRS